MAISLNPCDRLAPKEKKFCRHCGAKLTPNMEIDHYDEYTGVAVRLFMDHLICPNQYCKGKVTW